MAVFDALPRENSSTFGGTSAQMPVLFEERISKALWKLAVCIAPLYPLPLRVSRCSHYSRESIVRKIIILFLLVRSASSHLFSRSSPPTRNSSGIMHGWRRSKKKIFLFQINWQKSRQKTKVHPTE